MTGHDVSARAIAQHAKEVLGTDLVERFVIEYLLERAVCTTGGKILSDTEAEQLVEELEALPVRQAAIPVDLAEPAKGTYIGEGSSKETAIVIKARNGSQGVRLEYAWIKQNHPDWELQKQSLMKSEDGKAYDKMEFLTPDYELVTIYFDITDIFGKD